MTYCVKENVPFTVFETWESIHQKVKEIVEGKTSVKEAAHEGYQIYKKGAAGVKVPAHSGHSTPMVVGKGD